MKDSKDQFRVSSALKSIVGKDLVTNDFVAVFELVKNSVDAGSLKVDIVFELESLSPAIWVIDDGKGMSLKDIEDKWLFLGYSAKKEGVEDEYKKSYAGNKGVGRFSCDRLGRRLLLQAKTAKCAEVNTLKIDWLDYEENSITEFTDIDVYKGRQPSFELPENYDQLERGTAVKLSDLREIDGWTRSKLKKLKLGLAKLVNPFGGVKQTVEINLHCSRELDEDLAIQASDEGGEVLVNGIVENKILEVLDYKTTGFKVSLKGGKLVSTLSDRGELIYKISEALPSKYDLLNESSFTISVYFLNQSAKATFARRMGIASKDFGSLFLFKNGFQVFPVGEEGNDYWGLDRRKSQGHSRYLGSRELMGRVDIAGDDEIFRESSSRDKGLIETKAAILLSSLVMDAIRRFERYVVGVTWQDKLDKDYETSERLYLDQNRARIIDLIVALVDSDDIEVISYNEDLVSVLGEKSDQYESSLISLKSVVEKLGNADLECQVENAEKVLKQAKKDRIESEKYAEAQAKARREAEDLALEAIEAQEIAEKAFDEEKKRNLFLTRGDFLDKDMLESFLHQIDIYASDQKISIDNYLRKLARSSSGTLPREMTLDLVSSLREGVDKITTTARYATLANFRLDSGKVESNVADFIGEYLEKIAPLYSGEIEIAVQQKSKGVSLLFSPIELGMVLDNFISNSRKSRATKIGFQLFDIAGVFQMRVEDDGLGLDASIPDVEERIFEKGFTRTRGSGLGLYFCREMIQKLGGEITLEHPKGDRGFSLIIKLVK